MAGGDRFHSIFDTRSRSFWNCEDLRYLLHLLLVRNFRDLPRGRSKPAHLGRSELLLRYLPDFQGFQGDSAFIVFSVEAIKWLWTRQDAMGFQSASSGVPELPCKLTQLEKRL